MSAEDREAIDVLRDFEREVGFKVTRWRDSLERRRVSTESLAEAIRAATVLRDTALMVKMQRHTVNSLRATAGDLEKALDALENAGTTETREGS